MHRETGAAVLAVVRLAFGDGAGVQQRGYGASMPRGEEHHRQDEPGDDETNGVRHDQWPFGSSHSIGGSEQEHDDRQGVQGRTGRVSGTSIGTRRL